MNPPLLRSFDLMLIAVAVMIFAAGAEAADVDFNRDVRPILSDKCFHCHGPDAATREADLRLDDESAVKADRDGPVVVKPGDADASELIRRITSTDHSEVMPPVETNKSLTKREIEILTQWVAEGAAWSRHWAYVPPVKYETPVVDAKDWPLNWVDNFILAGLEQRRIVPAPEADRVTLLRRVCFDLTGLPPSEELAKRFLQESNAAGYDEVVEQLLSSPHFGERMAIYWLDLVRYADTVGYHGDQDHAISPYRDWVIRAFNDNLPFDQFTREQLAGDLLPSPQLQQIVATKFLTVYCRQHMKEVCRRKNIVRSMQQTECEMFRLSGWERQSGVLNVTITSSIRIRPKTSILWLRSLQILMTKATSPTAPMPYPRVAIRNWTCRRRNNHSRSPTCKKKWLT
ncbi:MAG: DUF1549 domain-containing protein [Planctomycetaceae bacterium]